MPGPYGIGVFSATKRLNAPNYSESLAGTGSPQGVVSAPPGSTYLDVSTNNFWAKNSGMGNTGWVLLISS
jgi:hypothetical protein